MAASFRELKLHEVVPLRLIIWSTQKQCSIQNATKELTKSTISAF